MCVIVRDLIVFGVLTDMMRGRPAVYATFSSYDEVAHHSGLAARRHARGAAQARPAVRPHRARPPPTPRARTRSSSSPTTARRRARPSSSATATASTSWSSARSRGGEVAEFAGGDEQSAMVGHALSEATGPQAGEAAEERRLRPRRRRPRLGQPRPRLPDGGAASSHPRGDRRAPSRADPAPARAPARRLAARALVRARARSCSGPRGERQLADGRGRGRGPARAPSRRPRPATCCAPTASSTSPTSWSAASTTPSSTRAARSRS